VTSRAAARRYARALFDVAVAERADLDRIEQDLTATSAFVAGHDGLARALGHPAVPAARKRAVVEQLIERSPVDQLVARVLLLLAERDRLTLLADVAEAYRERLMDHKQIVRAEVTTAIDLPADRVASLQQGLARATGRQVQLGVRVDPAIVGGAVARLGSTVFDGSITTQLARLKQQLAEAES
jgi:F-type H+-transporting ATPase subunit delta